MTYAYQNGLNLVANTSYLISLNATRISGDTNLALGSGGVNNVLGSPIITTSGVQSYNFTPTTNVNNLGLKRNAGGSGAVWEITSFSVIEITDDTNLPRINYEGFSYQDALGSEEVVNGNFDDGLNGWATSGSTPATVLNGIATIPDTSYIFQNALAEGKQGKIVVNGNGSVRYRIGTDLGYSGQTTMPFTVYGTFGQNSRIQIQNSSGTDVTIDNVSVKEYLGQEVVPNSGCGSWLFEPQSTNLVTDSKDLSPYWLASGATIENTSIVSPDGTQNVKSVKTSSTGPYQGILRTETSAFADKTLTLSTFAKKSNNDYIFFYNIGGVQGNQGVWFNINNGTIGTNLSGWTNTKIEDYGNGWYRCSSTITFTASGQDYIYIQNSNSDGNINSDINQETYIWGAQLEQQSYATSYIPTNGSTVTRNQDVCTNGGSLATINSTEGILYAEIAALTDGGTFRAISLNDGTTNNNNVIRIYCASADNRITIIIRSNGNLVLNYNHTLTSIIDFNKVAIKYKQNNFSLWVNGVNIHTETTGNTPIGLNELVFNNGLGTELFYGKTKALAVWKEALSDQELADLTYPTPTDPTFTLDFDTIAEQFTFARGSEATYVDAQGLIQSTNEIGPELITNGDFATDTDWSKGTGWSISGGSANCDGTQTSATNLIQNPLALGTGKIFKIEFELKDYQAGELIYVNLTGTGTLDFENVNANGTYVAYSGLSTGDNFITFRADSDFIGSIDNVSVKEVTTATNTPRLDYSTGAEAFLLEPQSTNLIPYSEDYNSGNWYEYNETSLTFDASQSNPSGANGSYKIESLSGLGRFGLSAITVAPSTNYTLSFYVKNIDATLLKVILGSGASPGSYTYTSEVNTSDWSRVSVNFTTGAVTSMQIQFLRDLPIGESAYIWGAQLEQQDYATSYIPTNGSQTTRNQETCINATPEINSEEGVLYAEINGGQISTDSRYIGLSNGTASNRVILGYGGNQSKVTCFVSSGGSTQFAGSFTVDIAIFNKVAVRYSINDFSLWVNGVKVATDVLGATPIGLSELSFDSGSGGQNLFGNTKDVKYYPKALSDAELIKLTT